MSGTGDIAMFLKSVQCADTSITNVCGGNKTVVWYICRFTVDSYSHHKVRINHDDATVCSGKTDTARRETRTNIFSANAPVFEPQFSKIAALVRSKSEPSMSTTTLAPLRKN